MKENLPKPDWPKVRKFLNDVHLWLGLTSGIIVFLICFSGTIYVYNTEIRELFQPELYFVKSSQGISKLSSEKIIAKVQSEAGGTVISIKIPADPERSYVLSLRKKEEDKGSINGQEKPVQRGEEPGGKPAAVAPARAVQYFVNPYTGVILGTSQDKTATAEFLSFLFSLHRWLLLDKIEEPLIGELPNRTLGSYINGTATILFTLGVITGIIIWIPKKARSWRNGLKVKWNANWKRVNHDLHNSLGFYSCILLFLMGITGPQWSFPWYREALRKALGTYQPADAPKPQLPRSVLPENELPASLLITDYIAAADQKLSYKGDHTITLAADSAGPVIVSKTRTGFFAPVAADKILFDQYTSAILETDIFRNKPFNERISNSIKAIHVGDVYGSFTKLLYFLACLVATSLPVTGTLIWINKFKKKQKDNSQNNTFISVS